MVRKKEKNRKGSVRVEERVFCWMRGDRESSKSAF